MKTVEDYILSFPSEVQVILLKIRTIVLEIAPNAVESINYGMPAYKTNQKPLVYFAAYKNHIGLYATPQGHLQFQEQLSKYKQGKGSVQFPLNQEIPFNLIEEIVKFKAKMNVTL